METPPTPGSGRTGRANGQLAFDAYLREERPDAAQANSLLVFTLTGSRVQAMTRFEGDVEDVLLPHRVVAMVDGSPATWFYLIVVLIDDAGMGACQGEAPTGVR